MITRSKSKVMSTNPEEDPAQANSSALPGGKAPSKRTTQSTRSKLSRSSATVKAQKTAAEAAALRRRLEREQALAQREREREQERESERRLAALQEQLEETELQAELTAIEAENSCNGSRSSQRSSTRVSVDRTQKWIKNHRFDNCINRDVIAVGCEQHIPVPSPGHSVPPPMATRATAHSICSFPRSLANLFSCKQ